MKRCLSLAALALLTAACADAGAEVTATTASALTSCSADIESVLVAATDGLTWPSESDSPIDILVEPGRGDREPTAEAVRALFGVSADAPIEERSLEELDDIASPEPGDPTITERYQSLHHVLEEELGDVRFFSFGENRVGVYIVGRTRCGDLAGIHASATET
ncbi:hypothetical protein A7982_12870 [Minicystis rosea]|nr:hypothetical protein A7982_12870 [Minicystis rosea]